jgi:hypothetical protein
MSDVFPEISVERLEDDKEAALIKIAADEYEVNIYLEQKDVLKLISFFDTSKESYVGGTCLKQKVHWMKDEDQEYILIGPDQDNLDIGFTFNIGVFAEIKGELLAAAVEQ